MSDPMFLPWIGVNYGRSSRLGLSLMILGESHYDEGFGQGSHLTEFVIRRHMTRDGKQYAFWTKIARTIVGPSYQDAADRTSFWESVAFYNYVQEFVGTGPRQRPTRAQLREAWPCFTGILQECRPDLVVVLGFRLWDFLYGQLPTPRQLEVPSRGARLCEASRLEHATGQTVVGYFMHPSAGFSPSFWSKWYVAYVQHAMARQPEW